MNLENRQLNSSLEGKLALITGASRGIGKAIAEAFAQLGATVIGTATTTEGAMRISDYLKQLGTNGCGMVLDVRQPESISELFKQLEARYTTAPSILVNNAGVTRDNLLMRMHDDDWHAVIDTNLTAIYRLSKACIRAMIKIRWGRIINISSVVGVTGNPGQTNYAAAKAGIIGFSKSLAQEVSSRNITVNVVAPGFIDTDMTQTLSGEQKQTILNMIPAQRLGNAAEVAAAVAFLASDAAAYITGHTLHVNGGMHMG